MRPTDDGDERSLVERAKMGEAQAYEILVRKYQHSIYRLCFRMTGTHPSADDLAQEAFIKAYCALSRFEPGTSFYAWVRRIAVNAALNYLKARQREEPWGENPERAANTPFSSGFPSPHDELQRNEARQAIADALKALPPKLKSVFVLHAFEQLKYQEIARTLHIPQGTVMSRLNRARHRLQKALARGLERRSA